MDKKRLLRELRKIGLRDIVMKEIILTYENVKPASRISIPDNLFPNFKSFCTKYGLFIVKGEYKIVGRRDIGKGGWSNKIKKKVSIKSKQGIPHYYISKCKKNAENAKIAESKSDNKRFGKKLGFPGCDQKFFEINYKEANSKQCDFSLLTLRNTEGDYPYNAYNNYVAQYFGFSLLSHFPHSFNCEKSAEIAKKYYQILSKYSKSWADKFLQVQRSAILFTEYKGIFLIRKFKYKGRTLSYDPLSLESTLENKIYVSLSKGNNIQIIDKNHFIIQRDNKGLKELKGENYGLMIFK